MALTSRKKRPLDRSIPCLRDTRLIIIATEGEKTEKQYFESPLFQCTRVQVHVLETQNGLSSPGHVISRLKDFAQEHNLMAGDQLWAVVDKDRWPDKSLARICQQLAQMKKYQGGCAISNPRFELWLYLHHGDWDVQKPAKGERPGTEAAQSPGRL